LHNQQEPSNNADSVHFLIGITPWVFVGMVRQFLKLGRLSFALIRFAIFVGKLSNSGEHKFFQWAGKNYASTDIKRAFRTMSEPMLETVEAEYYAAQEAYFEARYFSFYERNKEYTITFIVVLGLPFLGWKAKKWIEETNKNTVD
jgi:hypothetical protein